MIIKLLNNLGRRTDEHCENFNKETENTGKYQILSQVIEMKNTIPEPKQTLVGFNHTLDEVEEKITELKRQAVEFTQSAQHLFTNTA